MKKLLLKKHTLQVKSKAMVRICLFKKNSMARNCYTEKKIFLDVVYSIAEIQLYFLRIFKRYIACEFSLAIKAYTFLPLSKD